MSTNQHQHNAQNTTQNTLGIIGGMSWESTESYYRLINKGIKAELGGSHSADLLMHSVDFAPIEALQIKDNWQKMGETLADSGRRLQAEGHKDCSSPPIPCIKSQIA